MQIPEPSFVVVTSSSSELRSRNFNWSYFYLWCYLGYYANRITIYFKWSSLTHTVFKCRIMNHSGFEQTAFHHYNCICFVLQCVGLCILDLTKFMSSLHHPSSLFIFSTVFRVPSFFQVYQRKHDRLTLLMEFLISMEKGSMTWFLLISMWSWPCFLKFEICFPASSSELFPRQGTVILSAEFGGSYSLSMWKIKDREGV